MTRWLCNGSGTLNPFLPGEALQPLNSGAAAGDEILSLHGLFAPGADVFICATSRPFADEQNWVLAIVDHALASQFEAINEMARRGLVLPDQLACLALTGKKFRGQRKRMWTALPGNLHLTARFKVDLDVVKDQASLSMVPSVATAEAIHALSGKRLDPRIKWVNDVWIGDGKVSGALTSASISAGRITGVTFGIGLNIDQSPDLPFTPFVPRATSLADIDPGMRGLLPRFFEEIVHQLSRALLDLKNGRRDAVFQRYRARAGFIGTKVRIWPDDTEEDWQSTAPLCAGTVTDLNDDLSLTVSGCLQPVRHGRLAYEACCRDLDAGGG